jgi:hypothetical protein
VGWQRKGRNVPWIDHICFLSYPGRIACPNSIAKVRIAPEICLERYYSYDWMLGLFSGLG